MNRTFRRFRGAAIIGAIPTATPPKQKFLRVIGIGQSSYRSLAGFLYATPALSSGAIVPREQEAGTRPTADDGED
jgi:hypothetical protein